MSIWRDFGANVQAGAKDSEHVRTSDILATVLTVRYVAVFLFRVAQSIGRRSGIVAALVKQLNQVISGADLAWQADVGDGLVLYHPNGVVLGPGVRIGRNCVVQQGVTVGGLGHIRSVRPQSPEIGDDVVLGAGCRVLGHVRLGDRVAVGANAVVTKDVAADHVATGVPAVSRARRAPADSAPTGESAR